MDIELNKPFGRNTAVDDYDVRQVKRALNRLGYYTPPRDFGATHIADRGVFDALKAFQRDYDIVPSGTLKPGDDTEQALNKVIKDQDPQAQYIWHTRQDDKVRSSHAAREGQVFAWGSPPDDGHPGEPFNCRCWAEPVENIKTPPKLPRKPDPQAKCFSGPYKDDAFDLIEDFELTVTWPYLDTKGKVTIGIGANVDRRSDFMAVPLRVDNKDNGPLATSDQKAEAYNILKNFAAANLDDNGNMNVKFDVFENITRMRLHEDIGEDMARAFIKWM